MPVQMRTLMSAEALRAHLDALNAAGRGDRAAGLDASGSPFLAMLAGPYAETEVVFCYSPWDPEGGHAVDDEPCDECDAHSPLGLSDLAYPVEVMVRG